MKPHTLQVELLNMDGSYPNRINMSDHNSSMFGSSYSPGTPHPSFEASEFVELEDWMEEDQSFLTSGYTTTQSPHQEVTEVINSSGNSSQHANMGNSYSTDGGSSGKERMESTEKVAFKTKSEVEILDDGFKWRKYGKKMVKNSPNPRNYYRCSVEGCPVKKRVERDREDHRYVITTYEGIHNHRGPSQF